MSTLENTSAINVPVAVDEIDAFDSASNPVIATPNYDLFGVVEISAYACALVKGQGKVPFDASNPTHRRNTAIDIFIQPLPEIEVKYPKQYECDWIAESATWAKITLPSIKNAGFENVREINGKYARVARVDSLDKPYDKKDDNGNYTGEKGVKKTFKFIEFFADEEACRKAYEATVGVSHTASASESSTQENSVDADKNTALAFLKVIVKNVAQSKPNLEDAKVALTSALAGYPTVSKHFTVESPETLELLTKEGVS